MIVGLVLAAMVLAGVLGSYCRAILDGSSDDTTEKRGFLATILPGVAASLIVPLFLNIGKSDLFSKIIKGENLEENLFILFAFCLLAAISAKNFLSSLAEKALNQAREANDKAKRNAENIETVKDVVAETTDAIPPPARSNRAAANANVDLPSGLDGGENSVVNSIRHSDFARRSVSGISNDTGIEKAKVKKILSNLIASGLVTEVVSKRTGSLLYSAKLARVEEDGKGAAPS